MVELFGDIWCEKALPCVKAVALFIGEEYLASAKRSLHEFSSLWHSLRVRFVAREITEGGIKNNRVLLGKAVIPARAFA